MLSFQGFWTLRDLRDVLQNSVPPYGILRKTSPADFQVLKFSQLAKMKKFISKGIIGWIVCRVRRFKWREEEEGNMFTAVGGARDLCFVALKSRTHPSTTENVSQQGSSVLLLGLEFGPVRHNYL